MCRGNNSNIDCRSPKAAPAPAKATPRPYGGARGDVALGGGGVLILHEFICCCSTELCFDVGGYDVAAYLFVYSMRSPKVRESFIFNRYY